LRNYANTQIAGAEVIEFDCEGCGWHVIAIGIDEPPRHGFCATCAWLTEYVAPEEIMAIRKRLDPETFAQKRPGARRP
jgi:hypothetical protein